MFLVPADGVKGKTWGPSSGGHVLSSLSSGTYSANNNTKGSGSSRPAIPEDGRWSKSTSSIENKKSKSNLSTGLPSVTSVPEMGKC